MSHLAVFESWSGFLAASHSSHLLSIFCPDQNLPAAQRVVAVLFVGGLFGVKEGLVQLAPGFGDWGYSRIQGSSLVLFGESRPNCLSSHFSLSSTLEVSTLPVPRRATESNWAPFLQHPSTPPPPPTSISSTGMFLAKCLPSSKYPFLRQKFVSLFFLQPLWTGHCRLPDNCV